MILHIPSTPLIPHHFPKHLHFFTIPTNHFIQYTIPPDPINQRLSYLYQPYNPPILPLITLLIQPPHNQPKSLP
ncbi:putative PEP-binding protein, partial [Bacillus subtilis]|uniref:putative PEP-binding protein n=1 Tax=Bacillus subtilis TaxID=1423 RepID=UPI0033901AED